MGVIFITNSVVSSVCFAISQAFGEGYHIYKELVKQNLLEPCFFVECVVPKRTQFLNNRYLRQHSICVHYFTSSADFRCECNLVLEKLQLALEYISVEGELVRGGSLSCKFTDAKTLNSEVSHTIMKVFVDFDFFTYEFDDEPELMDSLTKND